MGDEGGAARLVHGAVTVSSEERARGVFQELFGLEQVKTARVGRELTERLFAMDAEATLLLYQAGPAAIEVFVCPDRAGAAAGRSYDHLCLAVPSPRDLAGRAAAMGFEVRRFPKGDGEVLFVRDLDGNLYEIK